MRFQQLKRDSNYILRKKLVKSGKSWVVISSLALASTLVLLSSPTTTAKADTTTDIPQETADTTTNQSQNKNDSDKLNNNSNDVSSSNSPSTSVQKNNTSVASTTNITQSTTSLPTTGNQTNNDTTPNTNVNANTALSQSSDNIKANQSDTTETNQVETQQTTSQLDQTPQPKLTPSLESTTVDPSTQTATLPNGIDQNNLLDQGTDGTCNYYLSNTGTLYFTDGTLDNGETRSLLKKYSKKITAIDTSLASDKVYAPEYSAYLFDSNRDESNDYNNSITNKIQTMDLSKLDTSNVTNMQRMFGDMGSLKSLDLSSFDTSKVTNMSSMFNADQELSNINLSSFNTSKVTDMETMFNLDSNLATLDLSKFDTSNVTNMHRMFDQDQNLKTLDVSSFNTSKVTDMASMFSELYNVEKLDVSKFDTSKVRTFQSMFSGDHVLSSLDVSKFNTTNATDMEYMFYDTLGLSSLDVSNFDTSNVTDMEYMFADPDFETSDGSTYTSKLKNLDISKFNTSNVTNMSYMFEDDSLIPNLDTSNFDTSKVTDMEYMFFGDRNLTSLNLNNFNTSNVTNMQGMFGNKTFNMEIAPKLTSIDLSSFDTSKVTDMSFMFEGLPNLSSLDLSKFNTKNVTTMQGMFAAPENFTSHLTKLDLSSFNTENVTDMSHMFEHTALKNLDLSNFNTENVNSLYSTFHSMENLESLDISTWSTPKLTDMEYFITADEKLKSIDISKIDMSQIPNSNSTDIFYDTQLQSVTLGPKNKFKNSDTLPAPGRTLSWANVGSGSLNKPDATLTFSPTDEQGQSLVKYYDGSGKTGVETFVPYGTIPDTIGDPAHFIENVYLNNNSDAFSTSSYDLALVNNTFDATYNGAAKEATFPPKATLDSDKTTLTLEDPQHNLLETIPASQFSQALGRDVKTFTDLVSAFNGSGNIDFSNCFLIFSLYFTGPEDPDNNSDSNHNNGSSSNNHNSSDDDTNQISISEFAQTIATFSDQPSVQLWALNTDGKNVAPITNRALKPDSGWYSDKIADVAGNYFLRVSTNEWVKASEVYRYLAHKTIVETNTNKQYAILNSAENTPVTNRSLKNHTSWLSDRIAYLGSTDDIKTTNDNSTKYYRVATNEFVNANDVFVK